MQALEDRLNERSTTVEFKAYLGLKHIDPFIEDAVENMKADGIEEAISIVLAPHYSTFSVKSYNGRAFKKAKRLMGLLSMQSRAGIQSRNLLNIGQTSLERRSKM